MARPVLILRRLVARWVRATSVTLLPLAALACEEPAPVKTAGVAVDPAEQAKIEQGRKLLAQAADDLNEKKFDAARKALREASALGIESQRYPIDEALEKVDKRHAKAWAAEVSEDFKNKNCAAAFKQLEEPLKSLGEREAFTRELRRLVGADALACAQETVDQQVLGFEFAAARAMASAPHTKAMLGSTVWKKFSKELDATIVEALRGWISADLKARKWSAAVDKIDAAAKKGDASEAQVEALLDDVREGVKPEIGTLVARGLGGGDAGSLLKQVDQLATLVRWDVPSTDEAHALPAELASKRATLALWAEAQRLGFKPLGKPELRHAHGKVAVSPPEHADAPSKQDVPHGAQVWMLGTGKNRALVTTADPGTARLPELLGQAAGWASVDRLMHEKTVDWLVPDDQLKGERVWGPLRPPDTLLELGVVMEVVGHDITVQRLADGQNMKLTRAKLRSGRLPPGTKVLTFCVAKDQPAQVLAVPPTGKVAKLRCDGGQEKDEDLASLRSRPDMLPPTK